jgi:hypothetical protein
LIRGNAARDRLLDLTREGRPADWQEQITYGA